MAKEQRFFGTSCELGPHASRRGFLQAGLAVGTLALGQRAVLGQSGGAHAHMPELGVTKLPLMPAMDQPLVEPEVRRSANGVLSTSLRSAYAYRDIGGTRLYMRAYDGGLGPAPRPKGVLSTSRRCSYAYRDIGGTRLYLRAYEGGLGPTLRMKPGETLKIQLINDLPPNRDILPSNPSHGAG